VKKGLKNVAGVLQAVSLSEGIEQWKNVKK
jgi:hypothetical protein